MATEKNILSQQPILCRQKFLSTEEKRNQKIRKIEQQRSRVRLPKRKKSYVFHIFSQNDDYDIAFLSHLRVILSDLFEFHSSALLNYCLNDEKNGDKQSTTVLSTICRQKAID